MTIACAPTYPAAELTQSIEGLCLSEYSLHVDAWMIGKTVGIDVPVTKLFNSTSQLEDGASKRLEDAVQGLSRVILSTDANPDFFLVRAFEDQGVGGELVLIRNVRDMKKAYGMQISRGEYLERSVLQRRINPVVVGESVVRSLIKELEQGSASTVLGKYFMGNLNRAISPPFFLYLLEMEHKDRIRYELAELRTVRVSTGVALVWVKVRETHTLKRGVKEEDILFPSGFEHEWLFEVIGNSPPRVVASAAALVIRDPSGTLVRVAFPAVYSKWEDSRLWEELPFQEEVGLDTFVSEQAGRRIQTMLGKEPETKELFTVNRVRCGFVREFGADAGHRGDIFQVDITGKRTDTLSGEGQQDPILKQTAKLADWILQGYDYTDTEWVKIALSGEEPFLISRQQIR